MYSTSLGGNGRFMFFAFHSFNKFLNFSSNVRLYLSISASDQSIALNEKETTVVEPTIFLKILYVTTD